MDTTRCPACGTANAPAARFCTACGSPLMAGTPESPEELREEIRKMQQLVFQISRRLDVLEQAARPVEPAPKPVMPEPPREATVRPSTAEEPASAGTIAEPAAEFPQPVKEKPRRKAPREWEQILGGSWLARIGVLALVIGVGFFLKYAFDNNWIGPETRVIIGVIAGMVMIWMGYHWRNRYPIMTQVLSGGGIGILYLAIFAAFVFYGFINFYLAVFLLFLISAGSAMLSLRYHSRALAVIGIIGAFSAPFILGGFRNYGSADVTTTRAILLLAYIIVIDIGIFFLSRFRNWRWLSLVALASTLVTYLVWYNEFDRYVTDLNAQLMLTAVFLIFTGISVYHHVFRNVTVKVYDDIAFLLNGVAYFGASFALMWDEYSGWMGLFALLLAIGYLALYRVIIRKSNSPRVSFYSLLLGLIALTVAVPVQFRDTPWTAVTWAIEIAVLLLASGFLRLPLLRYFSYAVLVALCWRMMLFDMQLPYNYDFTPVLNERFPAILAGIIAIYFCAYLIYWKRTDIPEWRLLMIITVILANVFTIWLISVEAWDSFAKSIQSADYAARPGLRNAQNLSLTAIWAIYAAIALSIGIWKRWKPVRLGALILLAIPIVKVFVYDVFKLDTAYRIGAFVGLGLLLLVSAYLYQRFKTTIKGALTGK